MLTIRTVPPKGPSESSFVIVGDSPDNEDIIKNMMFSGSTGTVLNAALGQLPKGAYPEPYMTYAVKGRIGREKDKKKAQAELERQVLQYRPQLVEELKAHPRSVILTLGNAALWAVTGNTNTKITQIRGQLIPSELASMGILPAVSPGYLLHGNGSFRQFKVDVAYALSLAQGNQPHPYSVPTYKCIDTPAEAYAFVEMCRNLPEGSPAASDLETSGFSFLEHRILCGGVTLDGKHVHTFWGDKSDVATKRQMLNVIAPIFGFRNIKWAWHNGKFDIKFIRQLGIQAMVDDDTMLMSYALDETRGIHDLEQVGTDWLSSPVWKAELDTHKRKGESYDIIPAPVLERYMAFDIANTFNLMPVMRPLIEADKATNKQYYQTLIPASDYLAAIEMRGIYVNKQRVAENADKMGAEAEALAQQLLAFANEKSPGRYTDKLINSPKQLAELLFDDIGLISKERGTADDVLDKLVPHPFVTTLRKYRTVHKGFSTYVKPYYKSYNDGGNVQMDGKVHQTYLIHGTATGRLATREPNTQNIPRDPVLKGQFQAMPGCMFIEPDLNQAELRSLAALSNDTALCHIYETAGMSLHEEVRRELYGMPSDWSQADCDRYLLKFHIKEEERFNANGEDRIVEEQKMKAKNVNFGIPYGITEFGLAEQIGDTTAEAQRMLDTWAKKFPQASTFIKQCRNAPLYGKNLVTVFGYKKRFGIVTAETATDIQNEAANFPHQNVASTICMHAGIRTYKKLQKEDVWFVNTVHDSLLAELPLNRDLAIWVAKTLTEEMMQVPKDWGITRIPFVADAKFGTVWGSLGKMKGFFKEQGWDMPLAA